VYVTKHSDSHLPALAEVRDQARREYLNAKRREATDKFYQALLSRYTVTIEPPKEKYLVKVQ
jgi:hypothetical protein